MTLAALALSLAHGAWLALMPFSRWPFLLLPLTLFLRMALNAIDGMMAREHGMKSPEGAVLNELGDVVSDAALYLPFALVAGVNASLVVLVVISGIIGEMAGALGPMLRGIRRYDGPLGKSDRAFAFGLLGFLIGVGLTPGHVDHGLPRRAARTFRADHRQPGAGHRRRGAKPMTTTLASRPMSSTPPQAFTRC